jgi:hypothetical protein
MSLVLLWMLVHLAYASGVPIPLSEILANMEIILCRVTSYRDAYRTL